MNMKQHILAALREIFEQWENLLDSLSEEQITMTLTPSDWSIKDNLVHLWAWQQRSLARSEAARLNREPVYPEWAEGSDPDGEDVDSLNAWIFARYHDMPWTRVRQDWRAGFLRLLTSAREIRERDLLDGGRYAWLDGYSLADVLIGSYNHHEEHLDQLREWLREHRQEL